MVNNEMYYNVVDGSLYNLEDHKDFTHDEEWKEAGYSSIDAYFEYLINNGMLIPKWKIEK